MSSSGLPIKINYRDQGMIFSVSISQWIMEACLVVLILIYNKYFHMKSIIWDRHFGNFNAFIGLVIHPAFIFMGDFNFRRKWQEEGLMNALREELFKK